MSTRGPPGRKELFKGRIAASSLTKDCVQVVYDVPELEEDTHEIPALRAKFGTSTDISGVLVKAVPFDATEELKNAPAIKGKVWALFRARSRARPIVRRLSSCYAGRADTAWRMLISRQGAASTEGWSDRIDHVQQQPG